MPADFYPKREAEIVILTGNFSSRISADPAMYGLTAEDSAEYAAVRQAFVELYKKSSRGNTNTSAVVAGKKTARRALETLTRRLAWAVRTQPHVTSAERIALGLPLRDRGRPRGSRNVDGVAQMQRIGPPLLSVKSVHGRTMQIRLRDRTAPMNRGNPKGVDGATVFSYVGKHPPSSDDHDSWTFALNTSKTVVNMPVGRRDDVLPPGTKVWFIACWMNRRGHAGPTCDPVNAYTQYYVPVPGESEAHAAA